MARLFQLLKGYDLNFLKTACSLTALIITFTLSALGPPAQAEPGENDSKPVSGETYFGQPVPGSTPELFAPDVLNYEPHDAPVFSVDETWMIVLPMESAVTFYRLIDGHLTVVPNPLDFELPNYCNGIALSPSGDRAFVEAWENNSNHLYYLDREGDGWSAPNYIDVDGSRNIWQLGVASSGNVYFSFDRVMVMMAQDGSLGPPVDLKLEDGSVMAGDTPYIPPDESYLICSMEGDLHISYRLSDGKWSSPIDLGPDINSDRLELCPQISPNGKFMFYNSRRNRGKFATYWVDAGFIEDLRPGRSE